MIGTQRSGNRRVSTFKRKYNRSSLLNNQLFVAGIERVQKSLYLSGKKLKHSDNSAGYLWALAAWYVSDNGLMEEYADIIRNINKITATHQSTTHYILSTPISQHFIYKIYKDYPPDPNILCERKREFQERAKQNT